MTGAERDAGKNEHARSFDDTVLAINFVAEAGKQLLETNPVSEALDRLRRFLPAVGLSGCALDATMSSLFLSYWEPGQRAPITVMREISVSDPRLARLAGTESLLEQVERKEVDLQEAAQRLLTLAQASAPPPRYVRGGLLLSVTGWVLFLNGLDAVTVIVALLATLLTFPVDRVVRGLRLQPVFIAFLAAVIIAAIPNLLAAAGLKLEVGPAVVGALFIYLPGRAFVFSVIDGLAGAPVSAVARGLGAVVTAGSLVLGMLIGTKVGAGLGLTYKPDLSATPLALSVTGAALGLLGIAVAWGMPRKQILPTVALGSAGWLLFTLTATQGDPTDWWQNLLAASLIGLCGVITSWLQGSTASVYLIVAILPLVPGFTLYRGVLSLSQGHSSAALHTFGDVAIIAIAIAVGLAIGLAIGRIVHPAREKLAASSERSV